MVAEMIQALSMTATALLTIFYGTLWVAENVELSKKLQILLVGVASGLITSGVGRAVGFFLGL